MAAFNKSSGPRKLIIQQFVLIKIVRSADKLYYIHTELNFFFFALFEESCKMPK